MNIKFMWRWFWQCWQWENLMSLKISNISSMWIWWWCWQCWKWNNFFFDLKISISPSSDFGYAENDGWVDKFGCWTKVFRHKLWVSAEKSATVAPRPRKLWSHRRTSIFSKNFRDLGKFPCCLRFFAELCKFPRHLYFPKIREFPGCQNCLKNSRKLCKFPGHPILDFNLPGRRPICTSVIPPPPVFSAADNCELTERPHKCLDSDTTALKYIPPSTERYSSQDILTSINQPRQKSLMYRSEKSVLSRLHEVMTEGTSEIYKVFKLPGRSILKSSW